MPTRRSKRLIEGRLSSDAPTSRRPAKRRKRSSDSTAGNSGTEQKHNRINRPSPNSNTTIELVATRVSLKQQQQQQQQQQDGMAEQCGQLQPSRRIQKMEPPNPQLVDNPLRRKEPQKKKAKMKKSERTVEKHSSARKFDTSAPSVTVSSCLELSVKEPAKEVEALASIAHHRIAILQ